MSDSFPPMMDEFPAEVPMNPLLTMQLFQLNDYPVHAVVDGVKPSNSQRNIEPGDQCVVSLTNSRLNSDVVVAEILDPSEHAIQFPDWEERVMRSYVLVNWVADEDPTGGIGWFDLTRMVVLTKEQYSDLHTRIVIEEMGTPPEWLMPLYAKYLEELSDLAPEVVAKMVQCPSCQGKNVELHALKVVQVISSASQKMTDGKTVYGLGSPPEISTHQDVHLHCNDCTQKGLLSEDEWHLGDEHIAHLL